MNLPICMENDGLRLPPEGAQVRLDSLSSQQQQEIYELDRHWAHQSSRKDRDAVIGICKDWIEEHGGDREWWNHIRTQPPPQS